MSAYEELLNDTRLPDYAVSLYNRFLDEQKRREEFREKLEGEKAEFINGEVVVHSPSRRKHTRIVLWVIKLLDTYVQANSLGEVHGEKSLVSLTRNDYEPDICYFSKKKAEAFDDDQLVFPAPELIVEVLSESTEARDRGVKFRDYAVHGVKEYWIVDPDAEMIEQYVLKGEEYELLLKVKDGHVESHAIEGLSFPVRAAFDEKENAAAMRELIA